jgi:hypothetical protein
MASTNTLPETETAPRITTEKTLRYCSRPLPPEPVFTAMAAPGRVRAILETASLWVNGTVLHYYFFDQATDGTDAILNDGTKKWISWVGADDQKAVVRKAFSTWTDLAIGVRFEEVSNREAAEIRIGFMQGDGSWSYVGRHILDIGAKDRTMNFGWDLTARDGLDTATHEIGHTLGFDHEYQNPNAGIVWNEEAVYQSLAQPPNSWPRQTTYDNIIKKIPQSTVQGSDWDPNSIMEYPFEAGLIKLPQRYANGLTPAGGISKQDAAWVQHFYPVLDQSSFPELKISESQKIAVSNGDQANFLIRPQATRYYNIQTFGTSDATLTLFEDDDGNLRYQSGDNDSGENRNASLKVKLMAGRHYVARIRLHYNGEPTPPAVMMW